MIHDKRIKEIQARHPLIKPFFDTKRRKDSEGNDVASFGLGSSGYDLRLGRKLLIFKDPDALRRMAFSSGKLRDASLLVIDPMNFNEGKMFSPADCEKDEKGRDHFVLPPYGYALGVVEEEINLPSNICCDFIGKSTHARCGLILNCTPGEPGWIGYLTLELKNGTPLPMKLYVGHGICQARFYEFDTDCDENYEHSQGKYQNQPKRPVAPRARREE